MTIAFADGSGVCLFRKKLDRARGASVAPPVHLGRGPLVFQPLVLGPNTVPLIVDRQPCERMLAGTSLEPLEGRGR